MRERGFEPRSPRWQREILTTELLTHKTISLKELKNFILFFSHKEISKTL